MAVQSISNSRHGRKIKRKAHTYGGGAVFKHLHDNDEDVKEPAAQTNADLVKACLLVATLPLSSKIFSKRLPIFSESEHLLTKAVATSPATLLLACRDVDKHYSTGFKISLQEKMSSVGDMATSASDPLIVGCKASVQILSRCLERSI